MVDNNAIIEGAMKFRDGRKWKSRWGVMTKLSPVAGKRIVANGTVGICDVRQNCKRNAANETVCMTYV
ncbi:Hypothetical predicted protein [Cloeon dipterum]|uniref:Uncharacterized protein n=1 Tax=Cloeon dipterum TaxID=197152 RepID=A0A8S1DLK3_9INSE|nr:Hypothetical predicted protein [Cloeon dipterum]